MSDAEFSNILLRLRNGESAPFDPFIHRVMDMFESSKPDDTLRFLKNLRGRERLATIQIVKHIAHASTTDRFYVTAEEFARCAPFFRAKHMYESFMAHMCDFYKALDVDIDFRI
jgi:hypothetical protein